MSNSQQESIEAIILNLHAANLTIESFVTTAISMAECIKHPLLKSFLDGGITNLLDSLLQNDLTSSNVSNWGMVHAVSIYKNQMSKLTWKENRFQLLTAKMTVEQLQSFDVEDLMKQMTAIAPDLCKLMETLHAADSRINYIRTRTQKRSKKIHKSETSHIRRPDGDIEMGDVQTTHELEDEEEYWKVVDMKEIALIGQEDDEPEDLHKQSKTQVETLTQIVSPISYYLKPHIFNHFLETSPLYQYHDA